MDIEEGGDGHIIMEAMVEQERLNQVEYKQDVDDSDQSTEMQNIL